jgi:hypothetical protein
MPKDQNEFRKLLSEAPAAPETDTLTVVGALARIADAERFLLTPPNGRAETLNVAAVISSRRIAGMVGQALVELVLDAKQVPEDIRNNLSGWGSGPALSGGGPWAGTHTEKDVFEGAVAPFVAATPHHVPPATMAALSIFGGTRTFITANIWTADHHTVFKAHTDPTI